MKKNVTLNIEGMSCEMCVKHVTEALKGTNGVKKAKVSLESKTANVTYDDSKTDVAQMSAAVKEAGYQVAGSSE